MRHRYSKLISIDGLSVANKELVPQGEVIVELDFTCEADCTVIINNDEVKVKSKYGLALHDYNFKVYSFKIKEANINHYLIASL